VTEGGSEERPVFGLKREEAAKMCNTREIYKFILQDSHGRDTQVRPGRGKRGSQGGCLEKGRKACNDYYPLTWFLFAVQKRQRGKTSKKLILRPGHDQTKT